MGRKRWKTLASLLTAFSLLVAQSQAALADIFNSASATANYQGGTVTSAPATASIPVTQATPSFTISKTVDVTTLIAPGTLNYTIQVSNTGNVSLTAPVLADALTQGASTLTLTSGPTLVSGDGGVPGALETGETWTYSASYSVTPDDINRAADIVNTATFNTAETPPSSASATTTISAEKSSVIGTIFLDLNGNGIFDGDPPAGAGYLVILLDAAGKEVGRAFTDADGKYRIDAPPGMGYTILFRASETGATIGEIANVTLSGGQTLIDQDLPIDPSGVVYNSVTRQPVAGITVVLTDRDGNPLPEACLLPGQQNQVTAANGAYKFDIKPGAHPACPTGETEYRLRITTPAGYLPGLSTQIPGQVGALDASVCPGDAVPGGSCQVSRSSVPPTTGLGIYFLRFLVAANDPDIVNNHLPIDPVTVGAPTLTKTAAITRIRRGERVPFIITAADVVAASARIADLMPPGFAYVRGSARVNGAAIEPAVAGRTLAFDNLTPDADRTIRIELLLVTNASVATGTHVNTAQSIDPATGMVLATAKASVEVVPEHVFDCGEIIGRVFDDENRNGYQDKGEAGLPGVRVATVKGLLVTTDKAGRFHVTCADIPNAGIGSNFLMKLDTRTLPTGYRLTTENPRDVRLTRGKITKLNFGAAITRVVRLDLKDAAFEKGTSNLKLQWSSGIDKLIAALEKEPSTLRLTYTTASDKAAASRRLAIIENLIATRWRKRGGRYDLPVEARVIGTK